MNLNIDKQLYLSAYNENSVDCAKIKEFQFGDPPTDKEISVITLVEEMKPIFVEN